MGLNESFTFSHFWNRHCTCDASQPVALTRRFQSIILISLWKSSDWPFFKKGNTTTHNVRIPKWKSFNKIHFQTVPFGWVLLNTFVWIIFSLIFQTMLIQPFRYCYTCKVRALPCKKKLTPMAVMYQVRYPSVSGTGAGWRNLELSPLPLSNNQYVFNKRRYHQPQELCHWAANKRIQLRIYTKTNV